MAAISVPLMVWMSRMSNEWDFGMLLVSVNGWCIDFGKQRYFNCIFERQQRNSNRRCLVAQNFILLSRGFAIRRTQGGGTARRLQIGDTAGCKPALRSCHD
jgi:hypothetical protein